MNWQATGPETTVAGRVALALVFVVLFGLAVIA
jgi:hypothetical protein